MALNNKKIAVALSGGIDSGTTAALLKSQGFLVTGIFMRLSDSKEAEKKAEQVASILKIPFCVVDFRKDFKKKIIESFLQELKKGETPNPCVVCNKEIKFGFLLKKALSLGFDFLATGHYILKKESRIFRGKDRKKDQSYFLWKIQEKELKNILFPLGQYTKKEVTNLAKRFKFPVKNYQESQEICFIKTTTNDFIKKHLKENSGKIINKKGNILGHHRGLWFYTIGQRKGINLPNGPWYVLKKDIKKNTLVVVNNEKELYQKELLVKDINWISNKAPKLPLEINIQIRSQQKPIKAIINKNYKVIFKSPQKAITPGQSAVFYLKEELLGGGIIK